MERNENSPHDNVNVKLSNRMSFRDSRITIVFIPVVAVGTFVFGTLVFKFTALYLATVPFLFFGTLALVAAACLAGLGAFCLHFLAKPAVNLIMDVCNGFLDMKLRWHHRNFLEISDGAVGYIEDDRIKVQPVIQEKHVHNYKELPPPKDEDEPLPPDEISTPTFEEIVRQVPHNSLQICPGKSLTTGEYFLASLPKQHLLLIGSSQKGKSTEAAAFMDQLTRTHDRQHLLLALLDLEDLTCNLFAGLPHVLRFHVGNRTIKAVARSPQEVARHLGYLVQMMDYRYTLPERERAAQPHVLIYLEEFLELKRRLKGADLARMADDFTSLATRGLKANMHLMVCAQASYSQEEFREAMGQLVGINLAFCAPPKLAQSAGFMAHDLLKENFLAKKPGQFVIESTGITDVGIAPTYDLKGKLQALQDTEEVLPRATQVLEGVDEDEMEPLAPLAPRQHPTSTQLAPESAHPVAPALEAVLRLQQEGASQDVIIEKLWHVKKGTNKKYLAAREEYRQCVESIKARRQAEYEREAL
jgi:FtsK/SpoIIIE family